jgi:hypothetical protein
MVFLPVLLNKTHSAICCSIFQNAVICIWQMIINLLFYIVSERKDESQMSLLLFWYTYRKLNQFKGIVSQIVGVLF